MTKRAIWFWREKNPVTPIAGRTGGAKKEEGGNRG